VPVRDWLTVREFAEVAGVRARSTVNRWIDGENLPFDERQRPWPAGCAPVDVSQGVGYRRLWVPAVSDGFWAARTDAMRARRDELMAGWPTEKGWLVNGAPGPRCLAWLDLEAPWSATYFDEVVCHGEPELMFEDQPAVDDNEGGLSAAEVAAWLSDPEPPAPAESSDDSLVALSGNRRADDESDRGRGRAGRPAAARRPGCAY
jgi:hypothetical protein